jgi:trk system potassium uptake protein TrkA
VSSVIVVGGGKVGSHLTSLLIEGGHRVRIVELEEDRAAELGARFGTDLVGIGSGTEAVVLELSGIRSCDVLAAVTGADETNLAVAALARFEFEVPRVIARIVDPANAWMFGDEMGVDVALNQADLLAHLVAEEMSLGEMTTLLKLRKGQYALVEQKVAPGSPVVGMQVGDVDWPPLCQLVALIRKGELMPPDSEIVLQESDEVLAVAHSDAAFQLQGLLTSAELGRRQG